MNEPITKALYFNSNLLFSDCSVKNLRRQSPVRKTNNTENNEPFSHDTKEEVKIQDLTNVSGTESFKQTRDCVCKQGTERRRVCESARRTAPVSLYDERMAVDVAKPGAVTGVKEAMGQEELYAVLDLSQPKHNIRDQQEKGEWATDPECQISLIMEVDEIRDDVHVEVVEDENDEDYWSDLGHDRIDNFDIENWDPCPSDSHVAIPSTYGSVMCPDPKDTLLIDDQGIPYTLAPDGLRLLQIEASDMQATDESGGAESDTEMSLAFQLEDPEPELLLPDVKLENSSPGVSIERSQSTITAEKKSPDDFTVETAESAALPSLPIHVMASETESNTPILLLPPSHLQTLKTAASNGNSELMTLSLPFPLSSDTQSTSVLLVLSSPEVSCGNQSSSNLVSSPSSVALPSSPSSPCSKTEPLSRTTPFDLSGLNKSSNYSAAPTSPMASSSTSSGNSANLAKQLKTVTCSDMPTSFQEALLRLAVSAEQKNEQRSKCIDKSFILKGSMTELTQAPEEHCSTNQAFPASECVSVDGTDSLLGTEDLSLQTSTSPPSPGPDSPTLSNSSKQDPQALGPRRILYCQYCSRVFYYLSDLERHSITHSQKKPHVCQLCGKAFKRSSHLERHKHIHTGERNFECQLCPRRFREAAELTRHQRVHTGEKPFQCLLCHMRFAERNTLRRHTKRKHQGQQLEAMSSKTKSETDDGSLVGPNEPPGESAEWYVSTLTEMESDNDTGGE